MGPLPSYFNYYTETCKKNKSIHYIIINDTISKTYHDENIEFIKLNLEELNAIVTESLKHKITLVNAWKINEVKPLFGKLFKEQLKDYDFWGWCDLDIIWGDVRSFLNEKMLGEYDVITSKTNWTAGHFTLLRNNEYCNNLYNANPGIIKLLNSTTYYAFEECCHRWEGEINSIEYLAKNNLNISMYDIVKNAELKNEIQAHFKNIIREYPEPINYIYSNSKLTDLDGNLEFMYYHLITVKKIWRFYIPCYSKLPATFYITSAGIRSESESLFFWKIKRIISCIKGIKKSIKNKTPKQTIVKLKQVLLNSNG